MWAAYTPRLSLLSPRNLHPSIALNLSKVLGGREVVLLMKSRALGVSVTPFQCVRGESGRWRD